METVKSFTKPETERRGINIDGEWKTCSETVWSGFNSKAPFSIESHTEKDGIVTYLNGAKFGSGGYKKPQYTKTVGQEMNDDRQQMIVRQSSLNRSLELMELMRQNNGNTPEPLNVDDLTRAVIHNAEILTQWVMTGDVNVAEKEGYPKEESSEYM